MSNNLSILSKDGLNTVKDIEITNTFFKCASTRCEQIFALKTHALLGISPFNSYYSEENIRNLFYWTSSNFSSFNIFIPDTLPIYTFLALGYEKQKAEKKTRRQVSYLTNKVYKALAHIGISLEEAQRRIINVSSMEVNDNYLKLRQYCYDLYESNIEFQNECNQCRDFILAGYNININEPEKYKIAIRYLLDEMPFFIDSPAILGIQNSMFIYHEIPHFIHYLYNYLSPKITSIAQGFMQVVDNKRELLTLSEDVCQ